MANYFLYSDLFKDEFVSFKCLFVLLNEYDITYNNINSVALIKILSESEKANCLLRPVKFSSLLRF